MASVLRSVYAGTRKAQLVIKDMARFSEMARILARYGFGWLLGQTPEALRVGPLKGDPSVMQQTLPQRVTGALVELGPTFVKFGQIMSTRGDLLPQEFLDELQKLQDRVPPVPFDDVKVQVERALKQPVEKLFASFDTEPLASASIAQVHCAVTREGDEVVLKVQRPGVREKIQGDLSLLNFLARQAEDIAPELRLFNLVGMVQEFEKSIDRETDFTVEAGNIDRFSRNFRDQPAIKIPRVHKALSTDIVLTMERIRGRKLTEAVTGAAPDVVERVVGTYLDCAYRMIFHDGFFHGDLHPGNALLQDDGKLALLDFGMVGRLTPEMRDKVIDVVFALQTEDLPSVARTFFRLGIPEGRVDYASYEAAVMDVMERHFVGRSMADIQIGVFFRDLVQVAMQHRVRLPSDYTMLFKALVTTEGLAKTIAPTLHPVEAARPYIETAVRQRYSPERLKNQLVADALTYSRMLRALPMVGEQLLREIERDEFALRVDPGERMIQAVDKLARAVNRMAMGMAVGALLLAFALLASNSRDKVDLSLVAVSLGGLGVLGLVVLLVGLFRER
ncbi:MAG: AarF/ABC1/UbiB kinase family protein [Myxococcota bacterium]